MSEYTLLNNDGAFDALFGVFEFYNEDESCSWSIDELDEVVLSSYLEWIDGGDCLSYEEGLAVSEIVYSIASGDISRIGHDSDITNFISRIRSKINKSKIIIMALEHVEYCINDNNIKESWYDDNDYKHLLSLIKDLKNRLQKEQGNI